MIGYRVKMLREERKMSISELSSKSGVAKSYISSLERNLQTNPTITVIEKIAGVLQITLDCFLQEQDVDVELDNTDTEWLKIMQEIINSGISKEEIWDFIEYRKGKAMKD